jgi:methyl-accepting chemotaxis protein
VSKKRKPSAGSAVKKPAMSLWLKTATAALESLQANVFISNLDFKIIYINERGKETLRKLADEVRKSFNIDIERVLGASIHTFHRNPQAVEKILTTAGALPHQTEFSFGSTTLEARINSIPDAAGRVIGYVVAWEDVTYRQRLELDAVGQVAAIGRVQAVVEFGLDGTIVNANDNFLQPMGYSLDEIKGKHHSIFVDPGHAASAEYRQFWLDLAGGRRQSGRFRRLGKDGRGLDPGVILSNSGSCR